MSEASKLEEQLPSSWRNDFAIPTFKSTGIDTSRDDEVTYLCGNSLGLMPRSAKLRVSQELDAWAGEGVMGHHVRFDGRDQWVTNDDSVAERLAKLVFGCLPSEISYTGFLTTNLNALLQAFYRPTPQRFKLMCEAKAFPSDIYSFQNQVRLHNLDIKDALVLLEPREGEDILRTEDILARIAEEGDQLALVCLPAIQFYTGQYFDMPAITAATKQVGALSGWDLAHASGNVPLKLHDWGVDFAVFCSYKYLNSGPGNLGGIFIHDNIAQQYASKPRAAGWWAVDMDTRFDMEFEFKPAQGARGFAQSNVTLFGPPCMHASLDVFEKAGGVEGLSSRRQSLTGFLTRLLRESPHYNKLFHIMTDSLPESQIGAQISIKFTSADSNLMPKIVDELTKRGIIGDERKPNVLRWAPNALYNTHHEVEFAAQNFIEVLNQIVNK